MSDLEASVRAAYRPPAGENGAGPLVRRFDTETFTELARDAARQGHPELHLLAWSFAPGLPAQVRTLGAEFGITLRPVLIPRELRLPAGRRPPVFVEAAELEAEWVRHPDGTLDVHLIRFLPGLPISPQPAAPPLRGREGFDFIDYWAVDFRYDPGDPFAHRWRWGRGPGRRKLLRQSDAHWLESLTGSVAAVKVTDVFGYETLALLSGPE